MQTSRRRSSQLIDDPILMPLLWRLESNSKPEVHTQKLLTIFPSASGAPSDASSVQLWVLDQVTADG